MECPSCAAVVPAESRFCLTCGEPLAAPSQLATAAAAHVFVAGPHARRLISSDSIPVGGFTPGVILAGRYRIIGLLGRGGMGEVYRADDLKLGQPVALKFLPRALAGDPVRRERFFAEVRITRQLSHPNICRVYDIAEVNGQHFLSMEYIDGEDLASLIQRIGYLSNEKALDIARQLVAGLAAAHERGVLHRDLKPANVMVDGRGRVRITDFGLAVAATDDAPVADMSGTPAYMAPEQLAGTGATVRSDIYALGLVLYELYTGKRTFTAATLPELRAQKDGLTPTAPSELRPGIDPVVERVIMRCLERDPRQRPASGAQLAGALPGGDPLAAAIAAGETPSPELVAASGPAEGLRPSGALTLLAIVAVGSLTAIAMNPRTMIWARVNLTKPPDVLVERAREVLANVGHTTPRVDNEFGITPDPNVMRYVRADTGGGRWRASASSAVVFWYRESPRPLTRIDFSPFFVGVLNYPESDPPLQFPGEAAVSLDAAGRLRWLQIVPVNDNKSPAVSSPDWSRLFAEADLDIAAWKLTAPERIPTHYADERAAWQGALPDVPGVPARIEAAAYRGKPVSFVIVAPWTPSSQVAAAEPATSQQLATGFLLLILGTVAGGGLFSARRNLRLGRGDRRGATRLALFLAALSAVSWMLTEHHVAGLWEAYRLLAFVCWTLFVAGLAWVLYIAVEPFVRRRWPHMLVSWTRVLSGDWRDPLVGRDVLAGCVVGVATACLPGFATLMAGSLGYPEAVPRAGGGLESLLGTGWFIAVLATILANETAVGLMILFLFLLLSTTLRSRWAGATVLVFVGSVPDTLASGSWIVAGGSIVWVTLGLFALWRFGLVAFIVTGVIFRVFQFYPMTFDTSAWYSGIGYAGLLIVAAITVYGFRTSLGGRRLFEAPVV